MGVRALGGVFVLAIPVGSAVVGVGGVMGLGVGFAAQPDPCEVVGPIDPAMDRRFRHRLPFFLAHTSSPTGLTLILLLDVWVFRWHKPGGVQSLDWGVDDHQVPIRRRSGLDDQAPLVDKGGDHSVD